MKHTRIHLNGVIAGSTQQDFGADCITWCLQLSPD